MNTQSEQVLEDALVAQLIGQDYTRAAVTDDASMLANLKTQKPTQSRSTYHIFNH